ncbi:hypothetical protein Pst134EA_004768 [Puccinia striiformis f. sp. tritici]|nr:hypothetical protein Pst134EA_004768 [Puccinia striiformis f. sp. tritici]KAH9470848.1 hypothetical protein Pst134EA_004768 [Puccinia striiformis f. sp. tritici]
MTRLRYALVSILVVCLGCLGGFFHEGPEYNEIIDSFYENISNRISSEKKIQLTVPANFEMKDHVSRLTGAFRATESGDAISNVILASMIDLKLSGRIDVPETWRKYMMSIRSSDVNPGAPSDSLKNGQLLSSLYNWCTNVGEFELHYQDSHWVRARIAEFGNVQPTRDVVRLAIRFHSLYVAWRGYRILTSMVSQMAIYQTVARITPLSLKTVASTSRGDRKLFEMIETFDDRLVSDNRQYYDKEEFHREINKIVPTPYQVDADYFPTCNHWVQFCARDHQVVTELITVAQEMAPFMTAHGSTFWEQLEIVAAEENLQPLMEAYRQLCEYFHKGVPFDELFEYYTLVSKISQEIKRFGDHIELEALRAQSAALHPLQTIDSISKAQVQSIKDQDESQLDEIAVFLLRGKANLVMNYAEEFLQEKRLGPVDKFIPHDRARRKQIEHIAFLLSDVMSTDYIIDIERVVHQIGFDVYHSSLPTVIKHKVSQFTNFLQEEIKERTATKAEKSHKGSKPARETLIEWDDDLSAALGSMKLIKPLANQLKAAKKDFKTASQGPGALTQEKCIEQFNLSVKMALDDYENSHIQPTFDFPLHENPEIWQAILRTTKRELGAIHQSNADILIKILSRIQRIVKNIPVFDRIYYTLERVKFNDRKWILRNVGNQWKANERRVEDHWKVNKQKMDEAEFSALNEIYMKIINNSKAKVISYETWRKKILPIFAVLPTDLVNVLGDIFADQSKGFLLNRLKPQYANFLTTQLHIRLRKPNPPKPNTDEKTSKELLLEELEQEVSSRRRSLEEAHLRLDQEAVAREFTQDMNRDGLIT